MKKQPHGFIYTEVEEGKDYVFGSSLSLSKKFGATPILPTGDWRPFVPTSELQAPSYETNACASFGTLNALETLKMVIFGNVSNFSDRMTSKLSGTDPARGNTPAKVADTIKKKWSVSEEKYPTLSAKTVEEFYQDVPVSLQTLAVAEGAEFEFGYERVSTRPEAIAEALKYSPLGMSVPAWAKDENGEYYRPIGWRDNHWVACVYQYPDGRKVIADSYEPFFKTMRADFIPEMAMRYHLKRQVVKDGFWEKFLSTIRELFDAGSLGVQRLWT